MAYYLSRYVGVYRVKSHIDETTNDFPRDEEGKLEQNDVYIKCEKGGQIYHYGHSTLVCYVPSIGRGHNILKQIGQDLGLDLSKYGDSFNYEKFYSDLYAMKLVFDIEETDAEILWKFDNKNMNTIATYMKPLTSGASISPFSTKNLPKAKYTIPQTDIEKYRLLCKTYSNITPLQLASITSDFILNIIPKKNKKYKNTDMKALMKLQMLKGKEFAHSLGMWDEYIKHLENALMKG